MRFKVKIAGGFRAVGRDFASGKTNDSVRLGITDDYVLRWYRVGFGDLEGDPVGPSSEPGKTEIAVDKLSVKKKVFSAA